MPAEFKIGLSQGTTTTVPYPDSSQSVSENFDLPIVTKKIQGGSLNVTYVRKFKKEYTFQFINKSKTDYETLLAYCNLPTEIWLTFSDNLATHFDNWAYLTIESSKKSINTSDFKHSFTIKAHEL